MARAPLPLCSVPWTTNLAAALADTSAAVARLDARICASFVAPAWRLRASWSGYASALRLQKHPLEEIDVLAHFCGLKLAGREIAPTTDSPFDAYPAWRDALAQPEGQHWREDLPFTFDPPESWENAPALVRALTLLDIRSRKDRSFAPWLAFPTLLHRMGLTASPLPCLVAGDPGQRFAIDPRPMLLRRLLKQLRRAADDGIDRLERLEAWMTRSASVLAGERRPGALSDLSRLALSRPCLAARAVAPELGLTISGAGKLLERARHLGMLVETSGRGSWRSYVTPDIALSLGLIAPERGRPRADPPPSPALSRVLDDFDAEMARIDAKFAELGIDLS